MSKKRRLALVVIGALVFVGVYSLGASVELSEEDATELRDEFAAQVQGIDAIGIFLNNIRIAAAMFIPGFGVALGIVSAFSTGMVFSALTHTTPELANAPPQLILATPFGVMEMFAYGMAMSKSAILVNAIVRKHDMKSMLKPTLIELSIVVVVLFVAAFVEMYMIEMFSPDAEIIGTA